MLEGKARKGAKGWPEPFFKKERLMNWWVLEAAACHFKERKTGGQLRAIARSFVLDMPQADRHCTKVLVVLFHWTSSCRTAPPSISYWIYKG